MSRSYKKFPAYGVAKAKPGLQYLFRRIENRRARRYLKLDPDPSAQVIRRKYGNEWSSPRDGKWCGALGPARNNERYFKTLPGAVVSSRIKSPKPFEWRKLAKAKRRWDG